MTWNLACPDWVDRLKTGRSLVPDLPDLNQAEGARAVAVFNKLRLADVPGTPTMAEAAGDWFRDPLRAMFGSVDAETGQRMIRELFLLVPKKNSKTSNGALLMTAALLLNRRPLANFIMTAPVQDVADLAFSQAAGAIRLDEVLSQKLYIREHLKTIVHRETKAELQIMTFDPSVLTGQKVSGGVLIDELHVCAKMSKAASAIRQLRGGMLPFPEAFLAFITTQSEDAPAGVFRAELQKARAIRDGRLQGSMLPVLYEFPPEIQKERAQWRNPANWHMVTPNAGRSITIPRLVEECQTAENTSEEELRSWASQHLNIEIGLALMADRWPGADFWEKQADEELNLAAMLNRCEVISVGVDGGGLDDLLGFAAVGRDRVTKKWLHWARAWVHRSVLDRRKEIAPRLLDLEKDGDLVIVDDLGEDCRQLAEIVHQIYAAGLLDKVGIDPASIGAILDALIGETPKQDALDSGPPKPQPGKIPKDLVIGIAQNWKLGGAIKTTERKLAEGVLVHAGQPLMAWCVGNAKVEPRANSTLITKQASGVGKIDPLMATFNAVSLMSLNPQPVNKEPKLYFF